MRNLKLFIGAVRRDGVILDCRRLNGGVLKHDWRGVTHAEALVCKEGKFRTEAKEHRINIWHIREHWWGMAEDDPMALLAIVLNTFYDHKDESWELNNTGMQLAYLAMAIVNHSRFELAEDVAWSAAFATTLRTLFPPGHPVWPFISLSGPDHGNPLNRN